MANWNSARVAFLAAAEGTEQVELTEPWKAVEAEGGQPMLVSPARDKIQMFQHLGRGATMDVDVRLGEASVLDFAGLVLPGGVANPDQLRTDPAAVRGGQAGSGHLPRTLDPHRGRRRARPHADILAKLADRPAQCRGHLGRPGGGLVR